MQFDAELWRFRARERHNKLSKKSRWKANVRLHRDLSAIGGIERVVEWCNQHQVGLIFTKVQLAQYDRTTKIISVSGDAAYETQLFSLLHECGHHLHDKSLLKKKRIRNVIAEKKVEQDKRPTKLTDRVDVIAEEFEAWTRGRKLAERLGIYINDARCKADMSWCLIRYFKWSSY